MGAEVVECALIGADGGAELCTVGLAAFLVSGIGVTQTFLDDLGLFAQRGGLLEGFGGVGTAEVALGIVDGVVVDDKLHPLAFCWWRLRWCGRQR